MSSRLSGKVCIITGTGGSIGREAARTFAREGALVVGCDLTVDVAHGAGNPWTTATISCGVREGHAKAFRGYEGTPEENH